MASTNVALETTFVHAEMNHGLRDQVALMVAVPAPISRAAAGHVQRCCATRIDGTPVDDISAPVWFLGWCVRSSVP